MDEYIASIEGGFYVRYVDDFVFAHPDHDTCMEVIKRVDEILTGLKLWLNPKKNTLIFFNGAGKDAGTLKGQYYLEFLGFQIQFNGTVSLKNKKKKMLLHDFEKNLNMADRFYKKLPIEERGR